MSDILYPFLEGGGEMGRLTRSYDWSKTPIGTPDKWPQSLRTTLSIILNSRFPMFLFWGPEHICFYNDAYRPSLGNNGKHPAALGSRAEDVWQEIWPVIKPQIDAVMGGGEATWSEDQLLPIYRNGHMEDVYWTYSYSPVKNEAGVVAGVFVTCTETTEKTVNLHKLKESQEQLQFAIAATELGTWDLNPATGSFTANSRLKEWFGLQPDEEVPLQLAVDSIAERDRSRVSEAIAQTMQYESGGRYEIEYAISPRGGAKERIVLAKGRAWFGKDKVCYRFNGTLQDITEGAKARQALEKSERRYRKLIKEAPVAMGLFRGRELLIETPNEAFIEVIGRGPDIGGKPLAQVMPELESQAFLQLLDNVFTSGETYRMSEAKVVIVKAGVHAERYFNVTFSPIFEDGVVVAVLDISIDVTEQVLARKTIEASQAYQQLLSNSVPAMIFYLDEEQRYRSYNNTFREWFGVDDREAIGKTTREFIGETAYSKVAEHLAKAYAGEQESFEMPAPTRLSPGRWLRIVYTPHKREDGSVTGVIVHATDITESKRAITAVEESEADLRHLVLNSPVGICVINAATLVTEVFNDTFMEIAGKPYEAIMGKHYWETFAEAAPYYEASLQGVIDEGKPFYANEVELMLIRHGKEEIVYVTFVYQPLKGADGTVKKVVVWVLENTAQVTARRKIAAAEAELRSAIELAELGTWSYDIKTNAAVWSQRHAEIFGLDNTEFDLEEAMTCIADEDRERVRDLFFQTIQPGAERHYKAEYKVINPKTGKRLIVQANGQANMDEAGNPGSITGTTRDITMQRELQMALENEVQQRTEELAAAVKELKAANEELEESNAQLSHSNEELAQYAYVASHDLQEPLRKIRVFTGLLIGNKELPPGTRPTIEKISASAERMSLLIQDLLSFSRLLKSDDMIQPVSLGELVMAVWGDFELIVAEKAATIDVGELPVIQAVNLQMNQLFYNLIGNALKFTVPERPPHIKVSARRITHEEARKYISKPLPFRNYHHVYVSDNGIGFEPQYKEQIFEVFKRLHTRDNFAGSGIGLALCRRIAANHGGFLYATSEENKGSVFHLILPDRQHEMEIQSITE